MPKAKISVEQLVRILEGDGFEPEYGDGEIRIRPGGLETQIRITRCDLETHDDLHLEQVISIRTKVPWLDKVGTPSLLGMLNAFAGLSALVRIGDSIFVASRMPVYRGESAITQYGGFIAMAAELQTYWVDRLFGYLDCVRNRREMPQPNLFKAGEACLWGAAEFRSVAEHLRRCRLATTEDENGVTSEFPWKAGAVSALFHHRTSLFEIRAGQNPVLGNGIFFKLELPAVLGDQEVGPMAAALNASEVEATDAPPFFGAWCPAKSGGRIAFVGFQPNLLRPAGMHACVALWNLARSAAAKDLIEGVAGRA